MNDFHYQKAPDVGQAVALKGSSPKRRFLGGGTNLVDLMRENIERPELVIDVHHLSNTLEERADGGLVIGAGVTNTALANHPRVRRSYPVLSQAILYGASAQIRNMATVGGNLMQRTRCYYFYDGSARCNKRRPGEGCDAREGFNRIHAILGTSSSCIATHPSDMCVALAALEAVVKVEGPDGSRTIPFQEFHLLPGDTPQRETLLEEGELITALEVPPLACATNSLYRKVRDRASYAFALSSVACVLGLEGDLISQVRIALGGVAAKPWRALRAEAALLGAKADLATFRKAAELELEEAEGFGHNDFKIELTRRNIVKALAELSGPGGGRRA